MSNPPQPPRYSTIMSETSIPFEAPNPPTRQTSAPYAVGDVCLLMGSECALPNNEFINENFGLSLNDSLAEGRIRLERDARVRIKAVSNRKMKGHGPPLEARYVTYTVEHVVKDVMCSLPYGTESEVKFEQLRDDLKDSSQPLSRMPARGERLYLSEDIESMPKGSAVIINRIGVPSKMSLSKRRLWVRVLAKRPIDVPYTIDRHLIHDELRLAPIDEQS